MAARDNERNLQVRFINVCDSFVRVTHNHLAGGVARRLWPENYAVWHEYPHSSSKLPTPLIHLPSRSTLSPPYHLSLSYLSVSFASHKPVCKRINSTADIDMGKILPAKPGLDTRGRKSPFQSIKGADDWIASLFPDYDKEPSAGRNSWVKERLNEFSEKFKEEISNMNIGKIELQKVCAVYGPNEEHTDLT